MSDLLVCPRCGPEWGLVLVPDEVEGRRVVRGWLGCPNCRTRYEIREGAADLTAGGEPLEAAGGWRDEDGAVRLAALLGLGERGGVVLLAGPASEHAAALAALVEGVEVLASPSSGAAAGAAGAAGVSALDLGASIPVRTGALHGVALTGAAAALVAEAARVLGPGARLLVDPAGEDTRDALASAGLRVVAAEGGVVVAVR